MLGRHLVTRVLIVICGGLALLPAVALAAGAAITGVVLDDQGQPLPGVTVTASSPTLGGEPFTAWADVDGSFRLEGLTPGTYTVQATLDGFQPTTTEITVVVDQTVRLEVRMALATFGETLEVKAEAVKTGEVAILEERRQAEMVSDAISRDDISRNPDSNAASVVERVTGISVVGDKYVFVRGLGERYSNTTLNGSVMPTTEPEKRVVPLDLFPAKLIDSVTVLKSYTPDRPGDFAAGVVDIQTLQFPAKQELKLSLGAVYDAKSTGGDFSTYGSGLSWNGEGGQPIPSTITSQRVVRGSAFNPEGYTPEELEVIGESFSRTWTGTPAQADWLSNFNLSYGNTFGRLGLLLSATSARGNERQDEIQNYYDVGEAGALELQNDYAMTTDSESVRNSLLGNFALRLSDTDRIALRSLFTRDGLGESRYFDGFNGDAVRNWRNYRLRYAEEEVLANQLSGEHFFDLIGLSNALEWRIGYSEATRHEDLRESLYEESFPGVYTLRNVSQSGSSMYMDLEDKIVDPQVSFATFYALDEERFGSVKIGAAHTSRERDFSSRRFRFVPRSSANLDLSLPPEQLFTPENIGPSGFEIREETLNTDTYSASHDVLGIFVMADATFGRWRLVGGVRWEDSDQQVTTFDAFDPNQATLIETVNQDSDLLPSIGVTYALSSASNLRFAASRTLNRPEFRELAPFEFTDVVGGRAVVGNPDLERALIDSVDLRWETFPSAGQVVAASLFYKRLDQPIEQYIQPTAQFRTSYTNAESADLWGAELEFRRDLAFASSALRNWSLLANYTYTDSNVEIGEVNLSILTNTSRPLAGQSAHVGNFAIQFLKPEWGTMVRLLYNYTGERISDVGALGLPDLYEGAYQTFDVVVSQELPFLPGLEAKIGAKNLTDERREFTQGGLIQRAYDPGRTIGFSLSYSIF